MPWKEVSTMSQRHEFMLLAQQSPSAPSVAGSDQPHHRLLARYDGRPRGPRRSLPPPAPDAPAHPHRARSGGPAVAHPAPHVGRPQAARPSPGPGLCHRPRAEHHHRNSPPGRLASAGRGRPQTGVMRFEHPTPNALWQMDFKGHFPVAYGRCHPLTVRLLPLRPLPPRLSQ